MKYVLNKIYGSSDWTPVYEYISLRPSADLLHGGVGLMLNHMLEGVGMLSS